MNFEVTPAYVAFHERSLAGAPPDLFRVLQFIQWIINH
jgi:hypothetical protein